MTTKNRKSLYLKVITMIDPTTDLIEIRTVPSARADMVFILVELAWLTRYPISSKVIVDRGNWFQIMIQANYNIKVEPIK